MARTIAYHVCTAAAMLLAVLFGSLLYAHQLSSGHGFDASLHATDFNNAIAQRDAFEVQPVDHSSSLKQHETRDEIFDVLSKSPAFDANSPFPESQEKVVIPSEYKKAKDKGELLLCYMKGEASPGGKGTSVWTDVEQLGTWGWKREVDAGDGSKDYSHVVSKVRPPDSDRSVAWEV